MKKDIRRNIALLLVMVMVFSCSISVCAEELEPVGSSCYIQSNEFFAETGIELTAEMGIEPAAETGIELTAETGIEQTESEEAPLADNGAEAGEEQIVNMPDAGLKSLLLGHYDENNDGELSVSELQKIDSLSGLGIPGHSYSQSNAVDDTDNYEFDSSESIPGYSTDRVLDLTGLEYATNIRKIEFMDVNIQDFSALKAMTNLTEVNVISSIINVSSLADSLVNCSGLSILRLANGTVTDLSALSSLTQLKNLNLMSNSITDITPLAALTNLERLDLSQTNITDLTPLASCKNLKNLVIEGKGIPPCDLTPLASCGNLETVIIGKNRDMNGDFTGVSAFASCSNLKNLYISSGIAPEAIFNAMVPDTQIRTLAVGEKASINLFNGCHIYFYLDEFEETDLTWSSRDPSIVDVTDGSLFEAKKAGSTQIYATYGDITKGFDITVTGDSDLEQQPSRKAKEESVTYDELKIVEEQTQHYYVKGSGKSVTITCNGEYSKFFSVFVDGAILEKNCYTVQRGSTVLTLMPEYLETLPMGAHTVTMNYTYGSVDSILNVVESESDVKGVPNGSGNSVSNPANNHAAGNNSVTPTGSNHASAGNSSTASAGNSAPNTGDTSAVLLWSLLVFTSGCSCVVLIRRKRVNSR